MTTLEERITAIERYLTAQNPAWNAQAVTPPIGASGSITITDSNGTQTTSAILAPEAPIIGRVVPVSDFANVRREPSTFSDILYQMVRTQDAMNYGEVVTIRAGLYVDDTYQWYRLKSGGYVREDVVSFSTNTPAAAVVGNRYPCPVSYTAFTNDFRDSGENFHLGWDLAGPSGTPVLTGPEGGVVRTSAECYLCGAEGKSSHPQNVLNDPLWNYGYGHYVIVRYDYDLLPDPTKVYLTSQGWDGFHAFVMYAHLSKSLVGQGAVLMPNKPIGYRGSSGNSSGAHLHLELRFGKGREEKWDYIRRYLADPAVMFSR